MLPSTVPRTFTDLVLISPRKRACSPIVSVPVEKIVPSTSPSRSSSLRNLTEPLIETPRERRAPPGTTDGSDCTGELCRIIGFREAESEQETIPLLPGAPQGVAGWKPRDWLATRSI